MPIDASFVNLGIDFRHLPRVAFEIFGLPIYLYGMLITLGVIAGILYAYLEAKRTDQNHEIYFDFVLFVG